MRCQGTTVLGKRCKKRCEEEYCFLHQSKQQSGGRRMGKVVNHTKFSKPERNFWDVYGKGYCPHTRAAVSLLLGQGEIINFYDITSLKPTLTTAQLAKKLKVSHSTVPMIFDPKNNFIGGNNNLRK